MDDKTVQVLAIIKIRLGADSVLALVLAAGTALMPVTARGQIFVANEGGNSIGEYNLDGTTLNPSLVSGLNGWVGIAMSGSDLFVSGSHSWQSRFQSLFPEYSIFD